MKFSKYWQYQKGKTREISDNKLMSKQHTKGDTSQATVSL